MSLFGKTNNIDPVVDKILQQVKNQKEVLWIQEGHIKYGQVDLQFTSNEMLQWVLNDNGPWAISLIFIQKTEDGELETRIGTSLYLDSYPESSVTVKMANSEIANIIYITRNYDGGPLWSRIINKKAVIHIRQWIRNRVLQKIIDEIKRRNTEILNEKIRIESLRKKYLANNNEQKLLCSPDGRWCWFTLLAC